MITEEKERIHQNESVTLTVTFSKEQMAILEKASDLMSHALSDQKWADVFTAFAEKEIQRRTEIKKSKRADVPSQAETLVDITKTSSFESTTLASRKAIRPNLRKTIFKNDQCCQFKDPLKNKICGSVRFLEIDHIQPIWAGGDNSPCNLRILCSSHNKFKYAKESNSHPLRWKKPKIE